MSIVGFHLTGGTGNNLFQIMATLYYAAQHGFEAKFCTTRSKFEDVSILRLVYDELFEHTIDFSYAPDSLPIYKEPHFHYAPIPHYPTGVELQGYYQSARYFANDAKLVQETFKPARSLLDSINNVILPKHPTLPECVGVHIRRGDYVQLQEYHPVVGTEYYTRAMDLFKGSQFMLFSDDIEWCKEAFPGDEYCYMDMRLESRIGRYVDIFLMSMCRANIIANSTFSWWGVYLNPRGRVVAPVHWFGPGYDGNCTDDLYPSGWEVI